MKYITTKGISIDIGIEKDYECGSSFKLIIEIGPIVQEWNPYKDKHDPDNTEFYDRGFARRWIFILSIVRHPVYFIFSDRKGLGR